jgi:hypothetical protein
VCSSKGKSHKICRDKKQSEWMRRKAGKVCHR